MPYTSPGSRGTAAILALYLKLGACLLVIGAAVGRIVVAGTLDDEPQPVEVLADRLLSADRLVELATIVEVAALVGAIVFCGRWLLAVRGNVPVVGGGGEAGLIRGWAGIMLVAVLSIVGAWALSGEAEDIADRQRIDALRVVATLVFAGATAMTILVVSRVTRGQEQQADTLGLRPERASSAVAETVSEGGLRVVSEADAHQDRRAD